MGFWRKRGLAGLPGDYQRSPAIAYLNREANKIFSTPEGRDRFVKQGAAVPMLSTDAFAKFMQVESDRYGEVIRKAGIKLE